MPDLVVDLLEPVRLTAVVDIGANPIDREPPYRRMLQNRLCRLTGFEPQEDALAVLQRTRSDLETYLPYAIGDGRAHTLRICRRNGMTSLLEPDRQTYEFFSKFSEYATVIREVPIETRRLDDVPEIETIDFLKIDIQGSELSVFRNGRSKLGRTVAIHTEVSFIPLYKGQPVFGEVDLELRKQGFVPHALFPKKAMIAPVIGADVHASLNQIIEADVVYVRDFLTPGALDAEQLKHLTVVAHHCYRSYDLAANCITQLMRRSAVSSEALERYINFVNPNRRNRDAVRA
jgi:FkbM family methyltransferase